MVLFFGHQLRRPWRTLFRIEDIFGDTPFPLLLHLIIFSELCGIMVTAWVIQMFREEKTPELGEPLSMRGDNASVVSWVNRCGGSRDRRAGVLMRMMGRMQIETGRRPVAKHIRGIDNVLADGIPRWPADQLQVRMIKLTGEQGWKYLDVGHRGKTILDVVLQEPLPHRRLEEELWSVINEEMNNISGRLMGESFTSPPPPQKGGGSITKNRKLRVNSIASVLPATRSLLGKVSMFSSFVLFLLFDLFRSLGCGLRFFQVLVAS